MTAMTLEQFSRKGGKARWKGKSKEEKSAHAKMMVEAREARKLKVKSVSGENIIKINKF